LEERLALFLKNKQKPKELGEKKPAVRKQKLGQKDAVVWQAWVHQHM